MKLICNKDPIELGIEDSKGNIHYDKFIKHIANCDECYDFTFKFLENIKKELEEETWQ
jgi:hypothetical protein